MKGVTPGVYAVVCLHCGAETESRPPHDVMYCFCRDEARERRSRSAARFRGPGRTRNRHRPRRARAA
jgi:hypothetical protein